MVTVPLTGTLPAGAVGVGPDGACVYFGLAPPCAELEAASVGVPVDMLAEVLVGAGAELEACADFLWV